MIQHVWSVLCSTSLVDKDTNNVSLIDVIEQWNIPHEAQFPINIANPFYLVTLWARSDLEAPTQGLARITLIRPDGTQEPYPEQAVDLSNHRRSRNRFGFQGFPLQAPGKHIFNVELLDDGTGQSQGIVASVPLEVKITDPQHPD